MCIRDRFVSIDKDGKVTEEVVYYKYEIKEVNADGYDVKIEIMDKGEDELGFVFKAKNTEKPEKPEEPKEPPHDPKNPPENPKNPPEEPKTPPEEPEKPEEPKTPSDEPKKETEDLIKTPNKESENTITDLKKVPREGNDTNNIPKTGVREDLMGLYLSGILLGVLVFFRRKLER